jgi:lincosamide nucleotidyltransferase A/C/D/E
VTAYDVVEILDALEGLRLWLDGGWGVDALLGQQTREHSDVDVAIDEAVLVDATQRLATLGFEHAVGLRPGLPARYVVRDARGRQVDFHVVTFDANGDGWQTLPDGTRGAYPAPELGWDGEIAGRRVLCISPELQLRHHLGYQPAERDLHDMSELSRRYGFSLPETLETGA